MSKFILTEPHTDLGHPLFLPYARQSCFLLGPGLVVVVVGTHSHQLCQDCPLLTLLCRTSSIFNNFRCKKSLLYRRKDRVM